MKFPMTFLALAACLSVVPAFPWIGQRDDKRLALEPYPNKPRVTFGRNGTFKLTVFSDFHFGENPEGPWGEVQDFNSTRLMKRVLEDEKPDYAVLNGDLITGEGTYENATDYMNIIVAPLVAAKVPFSSTHGNHDTSVHITHQKEIEREQAVAPLSYTRSAPPGVGGPTGPGNYWVPVYEHKQDKEPVLILWFFDSRSSVYGDNVHIERVDDWVDDTVGPWIKRETEAMDKAWGKPDKKRGALAFTHIPPHAVRAMQTTLNSKISPGLNEDGLGGTGSVQSSWTTSDTPKDKIFWDSLTSNIKNLHAIVSDHGNEWCMREPEKKVVFCFDKHSGYGGYDNAEWGNGVRNFVFSSTKPRNGVETWISYAKVSNVERWETRARVRLDAKYNQL